MFLLAHLSLAQFQYPQAQLFFSFYRHVQKFRSRQSLKYLAQSVLKTSACGWHRKRLIEAHEGRYRDRNKVN